MASMALTFPRVFPGLLLLTLCGCFGNAQVERALPPGAVGLDPNGNPLFPDPLEVSSAPGVISPNPAKLITLSNTEYLTSVAELTGTTPSADLVKDWSPSPTYSGFEGINSTVMNRKYAEDHITGVEKMVEAALGSAKVMTCTTTTNFSYGTCGQSIVERIAKRAYRRPLLADEKAALKTAFERGVSEAQGSGLAMPALTVLKEGVRAGLSAVFLAPQFMIRGELPPTPTFVGERPLNAYELATRLAFFFRGAGPDDELFAKAESGELLQESVIDAQIDRLIQVDKFAETFMSQWYGIHDFTRAGASTLEAAMWLEAKLTFQELVKSRTPVDKFLSPGFTYLVPSLGTHYGIPGSFSASGTRVVTQERGGMLMLGAFLTATSPPLLTSPIRRGKFVQSRVLCKNMPPPPEALQDQISASLESIPATATPKERIALHSQTSSVCYGCHQYMDPIGLGLEGFDPTGKKRTVYDNDPSKPVETDSTLLGTPFRNFEELNGLLGAMPEVSRCAAEKVAIFSLGRIVSGAQGGEDAALVDGVSRKVDGQWPDLREVTRRMVRTIAFRNVVHEAAP
jgi:hypothetical protein